MPTVPSLAYAIALITGGNPGEASRVASERLRESPGDHEWLHVLGYAQHAGGEHDAAAASVAAAIRLAPRDATYRNTLGAIELAKGLHAEAQATLREALAIDPGYAEARFNLALACFAAGDSAAGLRELQDLIARKPDFAPAKLERAKVLVALGRPGEAVPELRQLLARIPGDAGLRAELGVALFGVGEARQARELWASIAVHRASDAQLLLTRAMRETAAGHADAAIGMLQELVRGSPGMRAPHLSLAAALDAAGRRVEARAVLASAIERGHDDAAMLSSLAIFKTRACEWSGLDPVLDELRPKALVPGPNPPDPRHALYFDGVGPLEQRRWAENWIAASLPAMAAARPGKRETGGGGRYRIGILSAELREHPTARLIVGMLEEHDRERFEFIAYSHRGGDASSIRGRLERAFDRFVDVSQMSSREMARRIRGDEVDVLLDLEGHTRNSRLQVLALRPAPLQGHFVGYPGTLGASYVDLFISDHVATPAEAEPGFTEKVLRMPGSCQPNDSRRKVPARWPRERCGLPAGAIVFCCFNQPMKITRPVFDQWCRLLRAVEGSVLWLLEFDSEATANLRKAAACAGVDPTRLVFAPRTGPEDHLDRIGNADAAIDVFPCGSHTTASDALWAGVPLLTAMGDTFASRVAGSVLTAAGLDDLIFPSPGDSIDAAIAIAGDAARLAVLRARVERSRTSRLFDSSAYARDFEALLAREIDGH